METITIIFIILAGLSVSLIAAHLWVGIIDGIWMGIKRIFHIGRKQKDVWHTLSKEERQDSDNINQKSTPTEE